MFTWLRRKFLTGLIILLPTVLTGWILFRLFRSVDSILKPIVERYPFLDIPGLGFITVILILLLTGIIAGNFIGRRIISWIEKGIGQIPLVSRLYTAFKQMSEREGPTTHCHACGRILLNGERLFCDTCRESTERIEKMFLRFHAAYGC